MILVASCGERFAALGLGDLGGEVLHRVGAADQDVPQRLAPASGSSRASTAGATA